MKNRVQTIVLSAPVGGAAAKPLPLDIEIPSLDTVWRFAAPPVDTEHNGVQYYAGIAWGGAPSRRIGYGS